jgi:hypothetical protein
MVLAGIVAEEFLNTGYLADYNMFVVQEAYTSGDGTDVVEFSDWSFSEVSEED